MKKTLYYSLFALVLLVYACKKDFIVKDITDGTITINSPANNTVTTSNLITFWWEELDGAEKYNLQIVKPTFSSITSLILDTNITTTRFNFSLQPGSYQWRIRGVNAGGNSVYQTFNITVDTSSNLASQTVYLLSPQNGYLTGNSIVTFSWSPLSAANYYQLLINDGSVLTATTANTFYTYTVPAISGTNTSFTWKVKAFNDFSVSQSGTAYSFTIDLAAPAAPLLTKPIHGSLVKDTVTLIWSRVGAPDAKSDSVFVATDSLFTNVVSRTRTWQQSIKINQLTNPPNINDAVYWWRLRSIDSVGNRSGYSNQLKFRLSTP